MAAAWLVAVTVIAALAYLTWLVAMTVEKRLGNLEDDLDDVDNLVKAYHNASCGSFDRLTNASCAQIAQYDAVAGVASAASTLDAALNATGLGIDVAQDVSRLTDAAQVLATSKWSARRNMTRQYLSRTCSSTGASSANGRRRRSATARCSPTPATWRPSPRLCS